MEKSLNILYKESGLKNELTFKQFTTVFNIVNRETERKFNNFTSLGANVAAVTVDDFVTGSATPSNSILVLDPSQAPPKVIPPIKQAEMPYQQQQTQTPAQGGTQQTSQPVSQSSTAIPGAINTYDESAPSYFPGGGGGGGTLPTTDDGSDAATSDSATPAVKTPLFDKYGILFASLGLAVGVGATLFFYKND